MSLAIECISVLPTMQMILPCQHDNSQPIQGVCLLPIDHGSALTKTFARLAQLCLSWV